MTDLIIRNVRPLGADACDIRVTDGLIAGMGANLEGISPDVEEIEGGGQLVFPGFVDAHTYMDKTLMVLPWHRHTAGPSLLDKITSERKLRAEEGIDAHQQSMRHAERAIASGTTHIRSFADIDTEWGLKGMHGLMQTQQEVADRLTIQTVAFPQSGMLDPSTIDRDPKGHLDMIFELAGRYDVDIDVHLHERGELGAFDLEMIAERTKTLGYQGRVTISHAFCLGTVDHVRYGQLVDLLLENDIAVMSHGPSGNTIAPPVGDLRAAGVRMCCGNDGIQDAWGPLNRLEMLTRMYLLSYKNNWRRDEEIEGAIDICTYGGADVLGVEDYGLAVGKAADLVLVDAENHVAAVIAQPTPSLVMKRGRITARNGELV